MLTLPASKIFVMLISLNICMLIILTAFSSHISNKYLQHIGAIAGLDNQLIIIKPQKKEENIGYALPIEMNSPGLQPISRNDTQNLSITGARKLNNGWLIQYTKFDRLVRNQSKESKSILILVFDGEMWLDKSNIKKTSFNKGNRYPVYISENFSKSASISIGSIYSIEDFDMRVANTFSAKQAWFGVDMLIPIKAFKTLKGKAPNLVLAEFANPNEAQQASYMVSRNTKGLKVLKSDSISKESTGALTSLYLLFEQFKGGMFGIGFLSCFLLQLWCSWRLQWQQRSAYAILLIYGWNKVRLFLLIMFSTAILSIFSLSLGFILAIVVLAVLNKYMAGLSINLPDIYNLSKPYSAEFEVNLIAKPIIILFILIKIVIGASSWKVFSDIYKNPISALRK